MVFGGLWRHSYQKESLYCNLTKMYCRYKADKNVLSHINQDYLNQNHLLYFRSPEITNPDCNNPVCRNMGVNLGRF